MTPTLSVILCVLVTLAMGAGAGADQWQDSTGYPSASGWQSYQSYGPPAQPAPTFSSGGNNCGSGFNDVVSGLSSYKNSVLTTGASAAIAALLAKLPALIFLKVFIFKLIVVPMLFIFVAIPVLMPLLMMMMPMMMNMMNMMGGGGDMMGMTTTPVTPPAAATGQTGRAVAGQGVTELDEVLRSLLGSQRCLERVACRLGARDAESTYRKPVTWLLKQLQALVPAGYRERVRSYRQAYMAGAGSQGGCDLTSYPCETPTLTVQQDGRSFRIY